MASICWRLKAGFCGIFGWSVGLGSGIPPVDRKKSTGPAPTPRREGPRGGMPRRSRPWHDEQDWSNRFLPSAWMAGELGKLLTGSPGPGPKGGLVGAFWEVGDEADVVGGGAAPPVGAASPETASAPITNAVSARSQRGTRERRRSQRPTQLTARHLPP